MGCIETQNGRNGATRLYWYWLGLQILLSNALEQGEQVQISESGNLILRTSIDGQEDPQVDEDI